MNKVDFSNIGYDYGIKPFFMLVGDMEFSGLFTKANCKGVLYIFEKSVHDEMYPVQLAFLFQNEEPAEKFMDTILRWVEKSNNDGDAVAIEFIENSKGGYTLSISPEINRFVERMLPKHLKDKVNPIIMLQSHFKEIDTLGQNYLIFKNNYKKSENIGIGYVIGTPTNIVKQSKKFFMKKEFHFFKEEDIPSNSMASAYTSKHNSSKSKFKDFPKQPKEPIENISQRRIIEMKELLPLTYTKLSNQWLGEIQKRLSTKYDQEVIKQAICNLTIFERLKLNLDLDPDFTKSGYPVRILEYLLSTYESFDSYYPQDEFYTEETIIKQIENDKKELENYLKK